MGTMFQEFRLIGCIADEVPFAILHSSTKQVIVLSVGCSWQGYDGDNLRLVLIGPKFQKQITALACCGNLILSAVKNGIEICKRVNKIGFLSLPAPVVQMVRLGNLVLSLLENNSLSIYYTSQGSHTLTQLDVRLKPTCFAHPDTYVNKILIGGEDGRLQIWNFKDQKMIHAFEGWSSKVTCIESSPALDVVAIGLAAGRVVLFNLKFDEVIHRFDNGQSGHSTTLSFSSGLSIPLLATGTSKGEIIIWNLKEKEVFLVKPDAHYMKVTSMTFLPSSLSIISSSEDNSLKQWTLDLNARQINIHRVRSGPKSHPLYLKFYDQGFKLLTGDKQGSLWCLSTIQDQQSRELSAKKTALSHSTARPLSVDACRVRERDWGNVLSAHQGHRSAYSWSLLKYSVEKTSFDPPTISVRSSICVQPTCVALSQCGNFGFIGYSCGSLHKFNVQSGIHRGEFGTSPKLAHQGSVVGVAADRFNRSVLSVGEDGAFRIWAFKERTIRAEFNLGSPINLMSLHRGNSLCAISMEDLSVQLYDVEAKRRVRNFRGHGDRLTCMEMSSDGRWLITSSMDRCLRIYDIPSGQQIQEMSFSNAVVSFALAPSLEVLATAHINQKGVVLWSNSWIFGDITVESTAESIEESFSQLSIDKGTIKLAMMPLSGWSLARGSNLKEEFGALKPAKEIQPAPFFLPPLLGSNPKPEEIIVSSQDRPPKKRKVEASSDFLTHLQHYKESKQTEDFSSFLKKQSPVYVEQEIISISPESVDECIEGLMTFLNFLHDLITSKSDFELSQVLLKLVVRCNQTLMLDVPTLTEKLSQIKADLSKCWTPLQSLIDSTLCMLSLFSGIHE